jgi:hypothetical protein
VLLHERCLIGALIMAADTRGALARMDAILPKYSLTPGHAPVVAVIRALAEKGLEANLVGVCAELSARGELERLGGADRLMSWVEGTPNIDAVEEYARAVAEYRHRVSAQSLAESISRKAARGESIDGEVAQLQEEARRGASGPMEPKPEVDFQAVSGAPVQTAATCLSHVEESIDYVIEPILTTACLTQLHGEPKMGKSCAGLYIAICAATGMSPGGPDPLEITARKSIPVLFITFEDGPRRIKRRIIDYMAGLGFDSCYPPEFYLWFKPDLDLGTPAGVDCMMAALKSTKAKLLVLDTISHLHRAEENDAGEMKLVMANLAKIARDAACAVLYLHHSGKETKGRSDIYRGRGSSAIVAAADVVLNWGNPECDITKCGFTSKDDESRGWLFHYIRIPEGVRWEVHPQEPKDRSKTKASRTEDDAASVLSMLKTIAFKEGVIKIPGRDINHIMADQGLSKLHVNRALHLLVEQNLISSTPQGKGKTTVFEVLNNVQTTGNS